MIRVETAYVALDESRHRTREFAEHRNEQLANAERANELLASGATVHACIKAWGYAINPHPIFKLMTRETKLIISWWQCRDEPGYRVEHFDLKGMFVGGDAGSWSGPYGSYVTVADLERYARDTFKRGHY